METSSTTGIQPGEAVHPPPVDEQSDLDAQWNQLTATGCADWWLMTRLVSGLAKHYFPSAHKATETSPLAVPAAADATSTPSAQQPGAAAGDVVDGPDRIPHHSSRDAPTAAASSPGSASPVPRSNSSSPSRSHRVGGCAPPIKSCFTACQSADPEAVLDARSSISKQRTAAPVQG